MNYLLPIIFSVAFFTTPQPSTLTIELSQPCNNIEIPQMIECFANLYGASKEELTIIAKKESNLKPNPKGHNDGGNAYGVYQYHKPTFIRFSKMMGEELDYYSYYDQIKLTAWIFANKPELKSHWTTSKYLVSL